MGRAPRAGTTPIPRSRQAGRDPRPAFGAGYPGDALDRRIPTEVVLDENDGMPEGCALSLDNLTTVPQELFHTRITRLSVERMSEVCRALSFASGLRLNRSSPGRVRRPGAGA